ncbi:MAG: 30S ribosomal protein S5 [Candidatus Pacearchaeota archaeon]
MEEVNREEVIEKKEVVEEKEEGKEEILNWKPRTTLGKEVLAGKYKTIDEVLESGKKIMEAEIVDYLCNLKIEFLNIGQAKGKFGGGKRRLWRQTQKKTEEGNKVTFSVMAVVGDEEGHVGVGIGKASETLPAREKAIRKAKLNLIRVKRGCASFDCNCGEKHTIPTKTWGKCSSYKIVMMPAPQGTGLVAGDEVKKILRLAGIKDIYTRSFGNSRATINVAIACIRALEKINYLEIE